MALTKEQIAEGIAALDKIANLVAAGGGADYKTAFAQLAEAVAPVLPMNADGSPFTDGQLHAAKQAIDDEADQVLERDKQP